MLKSTPEYRAQAYEIMWYQAGVVLLVSLLAQTLFNQGLAVLYGGGAVLASTWHLYKSVYAAKGDRSMLFKAAGVRFLALLVVLSVGLGALKFQAVYLVAGMAASYVTMYAKSFWNLLRQVKGEKVG